ncbi:MAG: ATP synthase F1 subunit delta [Candidatus Omnitrophota bacterium]|nr:ATP synthase F1 subunit delta [Candidatus Omnitrophota bacterium]
MLIQLLVIQVVTFIGIIFLMRFLFSRHLKVALERLNTLHEENLAKEEELNEELKRAKEESHAQIEKGKEEAELIVEEAKKDALRLRSALEEEAKAQADKIVAGGKIDAEKLKEKCSQDIQAQSVELASRMISELLIEADKIALQYQFTNEIIEEIARLPKEQFNVQSKDIKVTSSFPLLDRQREELKKALTEKLGSAPEIKEQIDARLIGGLIVEIGGMVIDGTLRNKLQRIIPYLK